MFESPELESAVRQLGKMSILYNCTQIFHYVEERKDKLTNRLCYMYILLVELQTSFVLSSERCIQLILKEQK